ncbi:hypothetical protein LCGC14_0829020 [marine sediment metagenome]|uniref:Uncharacterized protein n=1 Tax=marine sediment metagenome TaxID=412755 RepID=A0A0F9PL98_9ZZZZ
MGKSEVRLAMKHSPEVGEGSKKRKKLNPKDKFKTVMAEYAAGTLHSGSGEIVKDQKQALAIAYSESGLDSKKKMKKSLVFEKGKPMSAETKRKISETMKQKRMGMTKKKEAEKPKKSVSEVTQKYVNVIKKLTVMNELGKKVYIDSIKRAIKEKDKPALDEVLKEVRGWVQRQKDLKAGKTKTITAKPEGKVKHTVELKQKVEKEAEKKKKLPPRGREEQAGQMKKKAAPAKSREKEVNAKYDKKLKSAIKSREDAVNAFRDKQAKKKYSRTQKGMAARNDYGVKMAQKQVDRVQKERQRELKNPGKIPSILSELGFTASKSSASAIRGYAHRTRGYNVVTTDTDVQIRLNGITEQGGQKIKRALEEKGYVLEGTPAGGFEVKSYDPSIKVSERKKQSGAKAKGTFMALKDVKGKVSWGE